MLVAPLDAARAIVSMRSSLGRASSAWSTPLHTDPGPSPCHRPPRASALALAALKRANGIVGEDEYEDDGNYGSAATIDLEVLQAISKRVHYGQWRCCSAGMAHSRG